MKKNSLIKTTLALLIVGTMSSVILTGCKSKQAETTSTGTSTSSGTTSSSAQENQTNASSSEEMKSNLQTNLSSLVSAGTITQAQSDKILAALTTQRNNPPKDQQSSNNTNSSSKNSNSTSQQAKPEGDGTRGQKGSPLSQLVTDGVITQSQADAVMSKIGGNMKTPQGNQPANSISNSSNSTSTTSSSK